MCVYEPFFPCTVGVQVPSLLSTAIPAEQSAYMHAPDAAFVLEESEEAELMTQIHAHNRDIAVVLDNFSVQMEQWRTEKDQTGLKTSLSSAKLPQR